MLLLIVYLILNLIITRNIRKFNDVSNRLSWLITYFKLDLKITCSDMATSNDAPGLCFCVVQLYLMVTMRQVYVYVINMLSHCQMHSFVWVYI